jgi:hypothetical protein
MIQIGVALLALAAVTPPPAPTPVISASPVITLNCAIGSNGLTITNPTQATLPVGTVIRWTVDHPRSLGRVDLKDTLGPGMDLAFTRVLLGVPADTKCEAFAAAD